MTSPNTEKLYELILHIRPLMKKLADAVDFELREIGITTAMRAIMEQLNNCDGLSVPELSRRLILKRQSIQPVLDKLFKNKIVERKTNPIHKRSWIYSLSKKGEGLINSIRLKENSNLDQISSQYSVENIDTANDLLSKLDSHFSNFDQWRSES